MKTIKMTIELTYDDDLWHSRDTDSPAKEWFLDDVLKGEALTLWDNDVGDEIGSVKVLGDINDEFTPSRSRSATSQRGD